MAHLSFNSDVLAFTDDSGEVLYAVEFRGKPFSGTAIIRERRHVAVYEYLDGVAHGECLEFWNSGVLKSRFSVEHGQFVGEHFDWYDVSHSEQTISKASAQLRRYLVYQKSWAARIECEFSVSGAKRRELLDGVERMWDEAGVLRFERTVEQTRHFVASGELAFTKNHVLAKYGASDGFVFVSEVMLANLESLLEDNETNGVLTFARQQLQSDRLTGLLLLKRFIEHKNLKVVTMALSLIQHGRVTELMDSVRHLLDDPRVPQRTVVSIGYSARQVFAQLIAAIEANRDKNPSGRGNI
jgi:hypothetical protein